MIGSKHTLTNWRQAERGQTVQDFAVGIGIFILAVSFVFAFIPTVMDPYSVSTDAADQAQADRIAAAVLDHEDFEADGPNHIDPEGFEEIDSDELDEEFGLRTFDTVTIGLLEYDDSENGPYTHIESKDPIGDHGGDDYVASATRLVSTEGNECDPACRLEVKIW